MHGRSGKNLLILNGPSQEVVKERTSGQRNLQSLLLGSGGILLAAFAGLMIFLSWNPAPEYVGDIYCDAEDVENGSFRSGGLLFKGGETRSDEIARSGKFSARTDSEHHYAMGYEVKEVKGGEEYMISIWRFSIHGFGSLVLDCDWGFYRPVRYSWNAEKSGWEEIRVRIAVPDTVKGGTIKLFGWNAQKFGQPVYFDDLNIWKVSPETNIGPPALNLSQVSDSALYFPPEMPIRGLSCRAYLQSASNGGSKIRIYSRFHLPLTIVGMSDDADATILLGSERILLEPLVDKGKPVMKELNLPGSGKYLVFRITGNAQNFTEEIIPWPEPSGEGGKGPRQKLISGAGPFGQFRSGDTAFVVPSGQHLIQQDFLIPDSMKLICNPGCTLILFPGADIISFGSVFARGTSTAPVVIRGISPGCGSLGVWDRNRTSAFEYVEFRDLKNLDQDGWILTGAVSVYESNVSFSHCTFAGNRSEDGLNLIRCEFKISDCEFRNTSSDAFDSDFCTGTISDCRFVSLVNDAMDFSGSRAEVRNVIIENAGDKGISIGEDSRVNIFDVEVRNSVMGIVAKDFSEGNAENVIVSGCRIAFSAFRKKPEFGPATLVVNGWSGSNDRLQEIGPGSVLKLDGVEIRGE